MSSVNDENVAERIRRLLDTIRDRRNRATLERFLRERTALGIKPGTLYNDGHYIRDFCVFLGPKPLDGVVRDDVAAFIAELARNRTYGNGKRRRTVRLSPATLNQRKVVIRAFFKWLRGTPGHEYPPEVSWLKLVRLKDSISPDRLPTLEDVGRLMQAVAATVPTHAAWQGDQGRAILAFLYECGPRASELCALNVGNLEFDEWGVRLHLPVGAENLKTGVRTIRAVDSEPFLRAWVQAHPRAGDPKAPLFFSFGHRRSGQRLTPQGLRLFIGRVERLAGLNKGLHPHAFRHAAVTAAVRLGMTEPELKAMFGWTKNSDMPSRYNHASGQDYENKWLERKGRKTPETTARSPLLPRICRRCKESNLVTNLFCAKCNAPLVQLVDDSAEKNRIKAAVAEILVEAMAAGKDDAKLDRPAGLLLELLAKVGAT